MPKSKTIPGIHIQWPWSQLILSGQKTVETRSYPIPIKYIGQELAIIETPGPKGMKEGKIESSRIVGTIVFDSCYKYENKKQWSNELNKHLVKDDDPQFSFSSKKEKWAWRIKSIKVLAKPVTPPSKRGITFVNNCQI